MRGSCRCTNDTGSHRFAAVEEFDVNLLRHYAQSGERLFHVRHEASWTTQINIRVAAEADFLENGLCQVPGAVKILAQLIARVRPAVTNIAAAMRQCEHETADFNSECVMLSIAGRVQPQDFSC